MDYQDNLDLDKISQLNWLTTLLKRDKDMKKNPSSFPSCSTCYQKYDPSGRTGVPCNICSKTRIRGGTPRPGIK